MMRTSDYLKILRDSWPIVLVCTIAFTGIAALASPEPEPTYKSTSTLAVSKALIDYAAITIDSTPAQAGSTDFFFAQEATQSIEQSSRSVSPFAVGLILGLAVGLGIAVIRYVLDRRLRSPAEAESVTALDVLAHIPIGPFAARRRSRPAPILTGVEDTFRRLRVGVLVRTNALRARTILIASSQEGDSSPAVARGLAESIAETGARVVLVDINADLVSAGAELALTGARGLGLEASAPATRLRQIQGSSLHILSAGSAQTLTPAVLGAAMVEELGGFDYVVVSAPPLLPTADAVSLLPSANAVLLVAGIRVVTRADLRASLRSITLSGGTPIGIVTTTSESPRTTAKMAP